MADSPVSESLKEISPLEKNGPNCHVTSLERPYLGNSWVEISQSAYTRNLKFFREIIGNNTELSVVVKANAYGHGLQGTARLAAQAGADSFCVHSIDEAMRLRRSGFRQNILVMGHVPLDRLEEVVEHNLRIALFNRESLLRLQDITGEGRHLVRVHLKLETGTYRHGIAAEDLNWFLKKLRHTPRIILEAVYTHYANIEDTANQEYAEYQQYAFAQLVKMVKKSGFPILRRHSACTAAILLFPATHMEMVRLGVGQYGLWPSRETLNAARERFGEEVAARLQPVLTWKTRIAQLKTVPADNTIGYGRTYRTTRETRLAVLPVGYSDGYDRLLSNRGEVLIRGQRAPVLGRICMNLMMVDVTDIEDAILEDEVVLLGRQGEDEITADEMAELCETINYEAVARINPDLARVVVL